MKKFARNILKWQQTHGRHDLPWQNGRDPYRIWISEVMLQQTQVNAVIGYFERFMQRFPNVATLASANIDEVMPYWAGLGYYARARNIHKSACIIMENFGGLFPRQCESVLSLPGVGRSTAAAICAFSYGVPMPILDGNVKRVFARFFGIAGDTRSKALETAMWQIAEREVPTNNIEGYIQGQMDIGATVCTPKAPKCTNCPLQYDCIAHLENRTHLLPERSPKKPRPHRQIQMLVLRSANKILIERRPPTGIWGGLWSLPEAAVKKDAIAIADSLFAMSSKNWIGPTPLPPVEHGFTHYTLTIFPIQFVVERHPLNEPRVGQKWIAFEDIEGIALPAPVKGILLRLGSQPAATPRDFAQAKHRVISLPELQP